MISGNPELFKKSSMLLEKRFGSPDFESGIMDFDFTDYYNGELGQELKRKFISFERLVCQTDLAKIKKYTIQIEKKLTGSSGKRRINLDPGIISDSKLVLATTKDFTHRIYLGKGIFAEVTLYFKNKTFQPWPWTYPDFKTNDYISFFNKVRELYLNSKT